VEHDRKAFDPLVKQGFKRLGRDVAAGLILMAPATLALALQGGAKKGDVRAAAEIAGVMAAKRTSDLIPLCHPLALTSVKVEIAEATSAVGLSVVFHMVSYAAIGLSTLQSRATAGLIRGAFVFCLPGSNGACKDGWSVIGPQLDSRHGPCNMVELMPRLLEK